MKIMPIPVFLVVCFIFAPAIAGAQRLAAGYVSKDLNYLRVVRFIKGHIQSLRWIHEHPADAADFLTKEFGHQAPYAPRHRLLHPEAGVSDQRRRDVIRIESEHRGASAGRHYQRPLPPPEKYVDTSYLRQAQKELGLQ